MHRAGVELNFPEEQRDHRRGAYPTKSTGISYGGGSKVMALGTFHFPDPHTPQAPGDLNLGSRKNRRILERLEKCRGMSRLAGFISSESNSPPSFPHSPLAEALWISQVR